MGTIGKQSDGSIVTVSAFMFVAQVFIIGLGGFVLLSAIAYAMVTENLALGIACGVLLFAPYVSVIAWCFGLGYKLAADNVSLEKKELAEALTEN